MKRNLTVGLHTIICHYVINAFWSCRSLQQSSNVPPKYLEDLDLERREEREIIRNEGRKRKLSHNGGTDKV